LAELGVAPTALPQQTDVDTWEDARAVAASAPRTRFAAEVATVSARLPVGRSSA
jgi:hypothetical protein